MSQNITKGYNDGFNHDFTDEDARRLVSIATSPELSAHTCRWVEGSVRCSATVQGLCFPSHLREYHGIHGIGHRTIGFMCQWEGCSDTSTFSKEGLMKHIQERHLLWKWNCPNCGTVFMHQVARNAHYARCPIAS
ncbi:hypothetical protein JVT61DRAFT_4643 [Boletus reticuloceps]|uniref:C2H2-type domain-containing protein n=1 Tax=Boletus reticuloceps TaxID=495285 RepID=A0A8I2YMQ6_9AGAM|nr:hypothetical protein JVT61DRAFT_11108 [Boletus reticuloceps]KAG6374008.1 hypothetical protein JVT61DRAFT_4643 [Boletus reticuloceps]